MSIYFSSCDVRTMITWPAIFSTTSFFEKILPRGILSSFRILLPVASLEAFDSNSHWSGHLPPSIPYRCVYVQSKVGQNLCYVHIYTYILYIYISYIIIYIYKFVTWKENGFLPVKLEGIVNPPQNLGGLTHLPACLKSQAKDLYL